MLRIGLTGGIGSGKTTVAKIFELLNVPVYYADEASKRLYETDEDVISSVKKHFGDDVYDGPKLNRQALAKIVFNNPGKLQLLNEIVHPPTIRDAQEWMKQHEAKNISYIIKEAALLFESGSTAGLDYVIGVKAPTALRLKRVMDREGISREEVLKRMDRQIDEEIKLRLCDFIIDNNEQQLVIPQVLQLHEQLLHLTSKEA